MSTSGLMKGGATRPLKALLVATIVAPILLFVGAAYTNYVRSFTEAHERVVRENDIVYEHAAKVFETHSFVLQQAATLVSGRSDDQIRASEKRLHDDLAQMIAGFPQIKDVFVHDRHGLPLVSTAAYPVPSDSLSIADRDYFLRQAERDAGIYVSGLWSARLEHMRYFTLTRRRPSVDGGFDGIISVSLRPDYFERFYQEVARGRLGEQLIISLTRQDGTILVHYPVIEPPAALSPGSAFERHIAAHPVRGYYEGVAGLDHVPRLMAYRKLPALPVYVLTGISKASIVDGWLRQMGAQLIYGLPATLGLFLITLMALRRTQYASAEIARREQAEAALRQSQKLEAIGQLTGGIAHDFNNLLAVISGSVQLLRRTKEPEKFLDAIERAARRGERLTRQLLTFSRQRRTRLSAVDLADRLPRVADMLARSLRGDIRLETQFAAGLQPVEVDGDELELALLNLAVNAQDAMPRGGVLTISARPVTLAPGADDGTGLAGGFVALAIRDTGTGMPADVAARAFEPFYTTKAPGKGSGLGLSQVYGFAHHCSGSAVVHSTPGEGTSIVLYLPHAGRADDAEPEAAADASPETSLDGLTVLLVEDDPEVRDTAAALLEDIGCHVLRAARAGEAQEILATSAPKIDLVLSDIVMPESISGIELGRDIRRKYPDLPVVLMTGYSAAAGEAATDSQPILFKPFTRAQLEHVVREHTGTRQLSLTMH